MSNIWFVVRRKKDKRILGVRTSSNSGGQFCTGVEFQFSDYNPPHLFEHKTQALNAIRENTPWYNSDSESPGWGGEFKSPDEVEVVEIEIKEGKSI
jgi:hypothetical protein